MNGRNCVKDLCNTHPLYLPHQSHAKNLPLHFRSNESCDWLGCCSYYVKPVHDLELIGGSFFFFFFKLIAAQVLVFIDALPKFRSPLQVGLSLWILE